METDKINLKSEESVILLNDMWEFNMDTLHFAPIEISTFAVTTSSVYYSYSFSFDKENPEGVIYVRVLLVCVLKSY
jgi:hypothetical protein